MNSVDYNDDDGDEDLPFTIDTQESHTNDGIITQDPITTHSNTTTITTAEPSNDSKLIETNVQDQSHQNVKSSLLSASGLLSGPSIDGGLFDDLDQEEQKAREAEERAMREAEERRRREEEMERVRIEEEKEKQKRLEEQKRLILEQEEAEERARNDVRLSQQNSVPNGASMMASMHELNLNDDSTSGAHQTQGFNSAPVYSNITQSTMTQSQPSYHSSASQPTFQNGGPNYEPQEARYGDASYYYSTSGSVQQVFPQQSHTQPMMGNTTPQPNGRSPSKPSVQAVAQVAAPSTPSSYALRSQMIYSPAQNQAPTLNPPVTDYRNHVPSAQSGYSNLQTNGGIMINNSAQPQQINSVNNMQQSNRGMVNNPMMQSQPMPNSEMYQSNGGQIQSYDYQTQNVNGGLMQSHMMQSQYVYSTQPSARPPLVYEPESFEPVFGPISVTDPLLVQSPGMFAGPPHWTYAVVVRDVKTIQGQNEFSAVVSTTRRRFKHFVALEERLRVECPGCILPPKPDKHVTRAIDEASAQQSPQFAMQRAKELETYLNGVRNHPIAGKSNSLRMFLTISDHLGAVWPEVSSSILTRLSEVGATTAVKVAESTSAVIGELNNENQIMAGEDNSELLALASSEGLRMSAVLQAVPKIENSITLFAEHGASMSVSGLEHQKLVNNILVGDTLLCSPFEILSSGFLRSGRRTSRMAVELGAAAQVFTLHKKLCRYERLAFSDRRSALIKRRDARKDADLKIQKLHMHQYSLQSMGRYDQLSGYGRDTSLSNEMAADAVREAAEIAMIVQGEVARVSAQRSVDWRMSMRVMATSLREAHAERAAVWESCREAFLNGTSLHTPNSIPETENSEAR